MTVTKLSENGKYAVTSETQERLQYQVDAITGHCDCPAGRRGHGCKHAQAVLGFIDQDPERNAPVVTDRPREAKAERKHPLGYDLGVVTSAMQKEIRRGDEVAAVYWATILAHGGVQYVWRRVLITAAEDIGLAAPEVVAQVSALYTAWQGANQFSYNKQNHALTMAIMLLCRAPKSTEVEDLQSLTKNQIKAGKKREILREYLDGHTAQGKAEKRGWDEWYSDRHTRFGIPVNQYTEQLWDFNPAWRPKEFPKQTT